eukprot:XP_011611660.1 PREDICTED: sodium- and chloride-dependent betaine transporter-like isoform X1 [Takifugu rubripes]
MADSETMADNPVSGGHVSDSGAEKGVSEKGAQPRAKWGHKVEFFLCASTQIISVENLGICPFLLYRYGGAFLIPYCLSLFFCGMPLLFLGLAIGQYTGESGVTAWKKICPMFQGIGIASLVILTYMTISHVVLPVWSLFYLYSSFKSPLPWTTCDHSWNTALCAIRTNPASNTSQEGFDYEWKNFTSPSYGFTHSAETEFWRSVNPIPALGSSGLTLQLRLIPCLLIAWVLSYFCTWKGIKYTGKIMYMVTFPYLLLIVFFFRAVTLPGAGEGLRYIFIPDLDSLVNPYAWMVSVSQALHFATCLGIRTSLGSYNKYNNNCYSDCFILCALQVGTYIFLSCIMVSFAGFLAHVEEAPLHDILYGGMDLLFGHLPKALSLLIGSSFWTVLFFLMLTLLSLSHQFVLVECLATNVSDLLPRYLRKILARELLVLVICGLCLLLGMLLFTKGGLILLIFDTFGLSELSVYLIVCFETIVIAWVYGGDRFYDNIADMIGYRPFPVLKYCWLCITPFICGILLLLSRMGRQHVFSGNHVWSQVLAFVLLFTPMMCIPVFMLISLWRGTQNVTTPSSDLRQARPHKPALTLCKHVVCAGQVQPEVITM